MTVPLRCEHETGVIVRKPFVDHLGVKKVLLGWWCLTCKDFRRRRDMRGYWLPQTEENVADAHDLWEVQQRV